MKISTLTQAMRKRNDTRLSQAGNILYDASYHRDRYMIDFAEDFGSGGWQPFDTEQDAWYFGVWVNPTTYETLSYAEGDLSLVVCGTPAAYNREVQSMIDYYEEGGIAKTYNEDEGWITYRQERARFLIPEGASHV